MGEPFDSETIKAATQYFDEAMLRYGRERLDATKHRNTPKYVGQFIDRAGVMSTQYGVYGMSAWLTLTVRSNLDVSELRTACCEGLKDWII